MAARLYRAIEYPVSRPAHNSQIASAAEPGNGVYPAGQRGLMRPTGYVGRMRPTGYVLSLVWVYALWASGPGLVKRSSSLSAPLSSSPIGECEVRACVIVYLVMPNTSPVYVGPPA
jgi:hypothetical protein